MSATPLMSRAAACDTPPNSIGIASISHDQHEPGLVGFTLQAAGRSLVTGHAR